MRVFNDIDRRIRNVCPCGGMRDSYGTWSHATTCWEEQHRREEAARSIANSTPVTVAELEAALRSLDAPAAAFIVNELLIRRGLLTYDYLASSPPTPSEP